MQLTFKQYLESKQKLREAVQHNPIALIEYHVKKYCTLTVGDDKESAHTISLKPKQKLVIEWHYADVDHPDVENIQVIGVSGIDENEQLTTFWSGDKLQKWLLRNTKQS